ncbi:D-amino acid aminotransferase [Acidihalobacter ferrooxydans]|uniref:Aminodeoxychorismate lyase n=1 Tax=Acidihalobacter ferrooxydans TaxID=1765967 RepID=A0A1P8UJT6_9GAMM|nr:D-amino acid aminotransferase [Acidihalobacter ferrooxydans]APZ44113.1 D-amino acid aminotransferase [Acidihalobacter ferrooxydans]
MSDVYLNGRFLPLAEAQVSVLDRGFLFGDGVYEVVPAYGGYPFRLTEHLARLSASLAAVGIAEPLDRAGWEALFAELLRRAGPGDQSLYLQITRGADVRRDHLYRPQLAPTVFAMCSPLAGPPAEQLARGLTVSTLNDIRWERCDIKAITLLANVMLRQRAREAGADDAILLRDGLALEGTASSLFVVHDGVLTTPPKGTRLLPGVTRDLVLELAADNALAWREADITEAQLRAADEIWLSSSTREVMPVTVLDGANVGTGTPGPVWHHMHQWYQVCKAHLRAGNPGRCVGHKE